MLMMLAVPFKAVADDFLRGDTDQDGKVTISDVTTLINHLLSGSASGVAGADTDGDGKVTISDVTCLIDYLLSGSWPGGESEEDDWVDLGLPSGTIWATRNVGASSPEDYGDYFAWGETEPKDYYWWPTYKWCNGAAGALTKYNTNVGLGNNYFVDNKTELDPEDDAACAHYPGGRMPTNEQQRELIYSCSSEWTTLNGVNGLLFTGPNGNTLFMPGAGRRSGDTLIEAGLNGQYWSRTLSDNVPLHACCLFIGMGDVRSDGIFRSVGLPVRSVRVP